MEEDSSSEHEPLLNETSDAPNDNLLSVNRTADDPTNQEVCQNLEHNLPTPGLNEVSNNVYSISTSNYHGRTGSFKCICVLACMCGLSTAVAITTVLLIYVSMTLSDYTGSIMLGSSDVMQILTFDPTDVSEVTFYQDMGSPGFAVTFYNVSCSAVATQRQLLNYTRTLNATSQMYSLADIYLVEGSIITWSFLSQDLKYSSTCVAKVYVFNNHTDYNHFTSTGDVRGAESNCIPSTSPLNFTLSAVEKNQHYFVGLESFVTTEFSYTVTGTVLKYNTTSLPPTKCSFPSDCPITWSKYPIGETVCILAQLEGSKNLEDFITLTYSIYKVSTR